MAKTQKPTGLSISRNGASFTLSWKIGDENYDGGQNLQYISKVNGRWKQWDNYSVTTSDTSKVITIDLTQWYPNVNNYLTGVGFRVRGKRLGFDWSDYTECTMPLYTAAVPTITNTLTGANQFRATYDIVAKTDDKQIYRSFEWQTILVDDSEETNGENLNWSSTQTGWNTATGTATSGNINITESTSTTQTGSHTRWVRIKSKSPAGDSAWAYTSHTYALPYSANLIESSATDSDTGYLVTALWNATQNPSRPIDSVRIDYSFAVPTYDMLPPNSPSWTNATTAQDTEGDDIVSFNVPNTLADDQCLFTRVTTIHDSREAYSNVFLARKGTLATPSNLSVNVSNRTATVSVTNNSTAGIYTGSDPNVKRLFLAVTYRGKKYNTDGIVVGIMTHNQSSKSITIPDISNETAYVIEVQAVLGTYTSSSHSDGTTRYTIVPEMVSNKISTTGAVPLAPTNVSAEVLKGGKAQIKWNWSWSEADSAELSWSDNEYAWSSTEEPQTFEIKGHKESFLIENLVAGKRYYLRVRLKSGDLYSPYSNQISFDMKYAPEKPIASLSDSTLTTTGKATLSWTYTSGDGTGQVYAEVMCGSNIIAHTSNSKHITLYAEELGWTAGIYGLKVRVVSESGVTSDWSDVVSVTVLSPVTAVISSTTLTSMTVTEDGHTRNVTALTQMPLTVTVTGAGAGGTTTLIIERAETYLLDRPDETQFVGYEGELIYQSSHLGQGSFTVNVGDLIGSFDKGAKYRIIGIVKDGFGQISTATQNFEVIWSRQAVMPTGTVTMLGTTARIVATNTGTTAGDVCDIYRLSSDKPELICKDANFRTNYIDPYPAIGGGYRFVYKTANGDYITTSNKFAWTDVSSGFEYDKTIIDFGTDKVELYYNIDTNHNWSKDFTETKYLGGSVQGDWNSSVSRTGNVSSLILNPFEEDTIKGLRRLSVYSGLCHIRTKDGSSFSANIEVSERRSHDRYGLVSEFSLSITRVDAQEYEGILEA